MDRGITKTIQAALTVTVVAFGATETFAQNSANSGSFSFTTAVDLDTNPDLVAVSPGTVFDFTETLAFSVRSETSTQLLEFFGNTGLTFSQTLGGGSVSSFNSPTGTLHYFRDSANSNLDLSGSYWTGDVINAFDADPSAATSIIVDVGTLTTAKASAVYNWGVNAPLGFSLNASYNQRDYEGITNPDLFDETTSIIGASANMRISPSTQGTLAASYTDYDSSDAISTSTQTTDYSFSVNHDLANALALTGNIGFRDKSTTASGITIVANGFLGGVGLTQTLTNGTAFGDIQFDDSDTLSSTALTFGRSLDLPDGNLTAKLTVDMVSGSDAQLLATATYTKQLSNGGITLDLSQSLYTDNLNQDIKFSTLAIAYQKTLNSNAGINLSLDLSRSEDGGAGSAAALNRATLSASYSQALTPDWDISVGYSHRQNSGDAIATADSDSVFLTLTRNLQFGF